MSIQFNPTQPPRSDDRRFAFGRLVPLVIVIAIAGFVIAMGWHRQLSLDMLLRHRAAIDALVVDHRGAAILAFMAIYATAVALSFPGAAALTICGGIIFGAVTAGLAAIAAATVGATVIFLVARTALGGSLMCRAGPVAEKLAAGFCKDAFSYLLFLRLVPLFPFWLVNIIPAPCGVGLAPFVAATAIGIVPGTFAYAFFGAGLDSVIAAQESAYQACLATQEAGCRLDFDLKAAVTPELIGGLVALGLIALIAPVIKRYRSRRDAKACSGGHETGSA